MKIFSSLYNKVLQWARHPQADKYLVTLSFAESSFFPVPPDVMLAPMSLAKPDKAIYYAFITTIASVMGGLFGYLIGSFFYDTIAFLITEGGRWEDKYQLTRLWFNEWGVLAIFIAGFSPIPYKVFTITAGIMQMAVLPFIAASLIGRGARFFLLASLMKMGGAKMEKNLALYIDRIGWALVISAVAIVGFYYLKG